MPKERKDLTGLKFDKLTAIRRADKKYHWVCACDCGKETIAYGPELVTGRRKSCGCILKLSGRNHHLWLGYGEISGHHWSQIIAQAKSRELDFGLSIEEAWDIFLSQNRKCALSGVDIKLATRSRRGDATASLDRINPDLGYSKLNVQWLHKWVNIMKLDHSQEDFLMWVKRINEHSNSR